MDESLKIKVVSEINAWIELLTTRITEIDNKFKAAKYDNKLVGASIKVRNIFLQRSLNNYLRVANFLVDKIENDADNSQMYLCQLRTLADILSQILFILSLDILDAARVIICTDLVNLKKFEDSNLVEQYYESAIPSNPIFSGIEGFPDVDSVSNSVFKTLQKKVRIKLLFPDFENRLDQSYIESKTFTVSEKFKVSLKSSLLSAHRAFSNHVHGNHFMNKPHGNETFWLTAYCLTLISCSCEVLDKEILAKDLAADIRIQLIGTAALKDEITLAWKAQKK